MVNKQALKAAVTSYWDGVADILEREFKKDKDKSIAKAVRSIVEASGYEYWFSYNDKRKDGTRRIKFMRNGWDMGKTARDAFQWRINKDLIAWDVPFKSAGWIKATGGRGPYDAFVVVI
jgi:hypothetical protein